MAKINNILILTALAVVSGACDNDWNPDELLKTEGQVEFSSMQVTIDTPVDEGLPAPALDVASFEVAIVNADDHSECGSWQYASMPEIVTLPEGSYVVSAKNTQLQPAAWESPYYFAKKEFEVKSGEVTTVENLACSLSNVAVSVRYSDALLAALGDDTKVTIKIVDDASLTYTKDEQRVGYFALPDGASSLVATFEGTVNGNFTTLTKSFSGITIGQHHYVTFSVNNGSIAPGLLIDADLTFDDVDIDIPGGEDPDPGERPGEDNQPTITSETIDLNAVNTVTEDLVARVDIAAPNGIEKLEVTIISDSLTPEELTNVGLTDHFDLAHPGEYGEALQGLGFPVGEDVIGKTSMTFDITMFMSLLVYFPGNHTFQLDVTDSKGLTVSAALKFYTPAL